MFESTKISKYFFINFCSIVNLRLGDLCDDGYQCAITKQLAHQLVPAFTGEKKIIHM